MLDVLEILLIIMLLVYVLLLIGEELGIIGVIDTK